MKLYGRERPCCIFEGSREKLSARIFAFVQYNFTGLFRFEPPHYEGVWQNSSAVSLS